MDGTAAGVSWLYIFLMTIASYFPSRIFRSVSLTRHALTQEFKESRPTLVIMDKISASVFDSIFKGEALAAKCKTIPRIVLFHEGVKFRPQFIIDACQSSCQLFRLGSLCTVDFFAVKIYLLLALFALRVMLFFTPRKTLDSMFGVPSHFLTETVVYCTRPQFVLGNGSLTCPTRDAQYIGPLFESPPALDGEMKTWLENVKAPIVFVSLNSICHENSHLPAVLQALAQSEYISLVEVTDQEYWCRQGYDSIRFVSSKDRHHKYAYLPFASVFITQGILSELWTTNACSTMFERFLTLSLVCCESRGEIMRVLRSRNSGSDVPKLQSMPWGNPQKLRSLISVPSAPRERPYERLRPLLRLARHGVIF
ncbi:hypothetical protein AURANDRAFT_68548 [Aureococcus anophagefferens]|uniref:Uncharacterized protein n=1 Tax=Aureococcus anophagefferens TaxID=44056 RepID=F0YQ02_AURAN|nr:hypothetical protein AURANDRAFT_68548 [Aureococcus anophagefferens]EGB02807.1 hypothetical protein AURANDRAFT_68548 [Aureococcus anophagefferens]|eukprot:XP_009042494.1 hypothetical protein AURANDRAFT_68548 [Aureococcus anophagefferens]